MEPLIVFITLLGVIVLYFRYNPLGHSQGFMWRRFLNWFPLGMSYAFLYMARYNVNVAKNALGDKMSIASFGTIFAAGTITYGLSFLINGPLVDQIGGKRGIILACFGAAMCNIAMGVAVWLLMNDQLTMDATLVLSMLYAGNMFFQSYGAVSIIKNKAYWFHVRERGIFGAIFGTLISVGIYFAFDWNGKIADAARVTPKDPGGLSYIFKNFLGTGTNGVDAVWLVFFIPSAILLLWLILNIILVKDTPSLAGHEDFDTHDASSGLMHVEHRKRDMLKAIFTNPVVMLVAFIEFTNGVVRNGIVQWYHVFANNVEQVGASYIKDHWGFLLCITGVIGGFSTGYISDKLFQSRRGPPVAMAAALCAVLSGIMFINILSWPLVVGVCAVAIGLLAVSIHGMMSGTAAADFGGRKMTATASGITDGFVYIGSGLQSFVLGQVIVKENPETWAYWPAFLIPFAILSVFLASRMWKSLPEATKRHLESQRAKA